MSKSYLIYVVVNISLLLDVANWVHHKGTVQRPSLGLNFSTVRRRRRRRRQSLYIDRVFHVSEFGEIHRCTSAIIQTGRDIVLQYTAK